MEALAASVISLVAPYLILGAEEFPKSVGKEAFDQCKALAERLKMRSPRMSDHSPPGCSTQRTCWRNDPESVSRQQ
jgi:hypothetical protein